MKSRYSIDQLADLAGISRRSVRFYVQMQLIPPPLGAGRGHYYTDEHADRLARIRRLQEQDYSLREIRRALESGAADSALETASSSVHAARLYQSIEAMPGITVQVDCGRHRLSPSLMDDLIRAVQTAVRGVLQPPSAAAPGKSTRKKRGDHHA